MTDGMTLPLMLGYSHGAIYITLVALVCFLWLHRRRGSFVYATFFYMLWFLVVQTLMIYLFTFDRHFPTIHVSMAILLQSTAIPFTYALLYHLTRVHIIPLWLGTLHLLPYAGALAYLLITQDESIIPWMVAVADVHTLAMLAVYYIRLNKYIHRMKEYYSAVETFDPSWMMKIAPLLALVVGVWNLYALAPSNRWVAVAENVAVAILLLLIAYVIYNHSLMAESMRKAIDELDSNYMEVPHDDKPSTFSFRDELNRLFDEEHIYCEANLKKKDLADRLGTNRTYISLYFQQEQDTTFYDYINLRRTQHAENLLATTDKTVAQIAVESGFNSMSSIIRHFKKQHGMTPTEWRNTHKNA